MKTILIAILAVLAVALASVLGYQKLTKPELSSALSETIWKTYRNDEYGCEIQYPQKWKIFEQDANSVIFSEEVKLRTKPWPLIAVAIYENRNKLSLDDWAMGNFGKSEKVQVGNLQGVKYQRVITESNEAVETTKGTYRTVLFQKGEFIFGISARIEDGDSDSSNVFDDMLSTFKFIK